MGINDLQWYPCLRVHLEDFGAKSLVVVTDLLELCQTITISGIFLFPTFDGLQEHIPVVLGFLDTILAGNVLPRLAVSTKSSNSRGDSAEAPLAVNSVVQKTEAFTREHVQPLFQC